MRYVVPRERDGSPSQAMIERHDDDGSVHSIPLVDTNVDAVAFRAWQAAGGVAEIAPPPEAAPAESPISWLEFMALFTASEQAAIATSDDPTVAVFRMMATGLGGDMNLADPRVALGLDALVAAGLIASGRTADILARRAPA